MTAIKSDVLDTQARSSLFDRIKNEFGHLDILFANAGIAKFGPFEETLEKDFDDVLRTNVTAVFLTVQAALALMGAGASIILNGSMAATIGTGESSAYAASRAGVRAMCRSLAGELSPRGIRVKPSFPALSKRRSGGERPNSVADGLSSIILYDGVCGLCNRFIAFVLARDERRLFRFASLQSRFAAKALGQHGKTPENLDTVYVIANPGQSGEQVLSRSEAILFVLTRLHATAALVGPCGSFRNASRTCSTIWSPEPISPVR